MSASLYRVRTLEQHAALLCESFHQLTGQLLVSQYDQPEQALRLIRNADFAVLSHGSEDDPIFNFANPCALDLFEMDWNTFTHLPSRKSAQAPNREERAWLLEEVTQKGFIANYAGIRISSSGKRFRIENAIVWNLADQDGRYCGQAAKFGDWTFLPDS
jgi:hypothetical protein